MGDSWDFSGGGSTPAPDALPSRPVGPPAGWLIGAAVSVAVGVVLGLFSGPAPWTCIAGWLIGGFAGVGMLAVFTLVDSRRRADSWYAVRPLAGRLRGMLVLLAIGAVALDAWRFADWWSRR
ncbi:MAG: hypothetical protein QOH97_3968 [Actinoplanes sp.]|nr:hypothetical protein [Actinoplanes sp.]